MPIRILDPTVAAQIAAGEVVERPASVARELIENALDAGARRILVEVRGGGLRELRVQDDGAGIAADEIELAFARHATSKLIAADDLWSIGTLGFRGEALPSIASVAQVVCVSRTAQADVGLELRIAGGEVQGRTPAGSPIGTSISVRNLFYNTPVRREFLRSESSEASAVAATVTQYALAYPEVRFTLVLDGRTAFQTSGAGDLRAVVVELYGLDAARQLLPVSMRQDEEFDALSVEGLISPPGLTRSTRSAMHLFVNRRVVLPRGALAAVIEEAYQSALVKGRHPMVVLNIAIAARVVDVNIHPTKSEVKFRDTGRVLSILGRAVREALLASGARLWDDDWADNDPLQVAQRRFELRRVGDWQTEREPSPARPEPLQAPALAWPDEPSAWAPNRPAASPEPELAQAAAQDGAAFRVIGQAADTYIVADAPGGIVLIEQHAAHERVVYERLAAQRARDALERTNLDVPIVIEPAENLRQAILAQRGAFAALGFELDDFGRALQIHALPTEFPPQRVASVLTELVQQLGQHGGATQEWYDAALVMLACHMAVPAGTALTHGEMQALLDELGRCSTPGTCPHGRPTLLMLDAAHLAQQFGRAHPR